MKDSHTEVYAWGLDNKGQLGLGENSSHKAYSSPRCFSFDISILSISCGQEHSAFISNTFHIYTMGSNSEGRLGIGTQSQSYSLSPCLIESLTGYEIIKISCGWGHTAAISKNNLLFTWGSGQFGNLGTGTSENHWAPIETMKNALEVSCGSRHTGVISTQGLFMCGAGEAGQLGTGKRQSEAKFVKVQTEKPLQVACGEFHTGFITENRKVMMMGGNSFGQLGIGNKKSMVCPVEVNVKKPLKLACGNHTVCITENGLFVWGNSIFGEFLDPRKVDFSKNNIVEVDVGNSFAVAVDEKGKVFAWGNNSNGELAVGDFQSRGFPVKVTGLKGKSIRKIAAGGNFCMCLVEQKELSMVESEKSLENFMETSENPLEVEKKCKKHVEEIDKLHRVQVELKEELQSRLQEANNQYHLLSNESFKLKDSLNHSEKQVFSLKSENSHLREEIARLKKLAEQNLKYEVMFTKAKETSYIEIQEIQSQLDKEKILKLQVERDLEVACSHKNRLESALAQMHNHLEEETALKLKNLELERQNLIKALEKSHFEQKELQKDLHTVISENKFYYDSLAALQEKYEKLKSLNLSLLEKSQNVKIPAFSDKKSCKVLNLHNIPELDPQISNRKDLSKTQQDRIKSAVHKLIENKDPIESPSPGGFTFRKSPIKSSVKSKIAVLMQNRSQIEKCLKVLQLNL